MHLDLKMALALINKMELKKGVVPTDSNETIVNPTMKETSTSQCLCKAKPCNCRHAVNPIAISLPNFAIHAFLAGQYGNPDNLYPGFIWNPSPPLLDAAPVVSSSAQVVSSSDQVVRQRNPSSRSTPVRGRKYVCSECQRSFDYKHVLQNHERTHTGEKPFECSTCQKKFTRDHHLKTHMRLHTGEKPYKCTHCDKDFVQVANLRRHIKVHELPKSPKEVKQEVKLPIQPLKQLCQRFSPLEDICTVASSVIVGPPQDKPEDLSIKKKKSMSSSRQFKIWSPNIVK